MGRSPEELAEVQRVHEVLSKAMDREIWQIAELMVGKATTNCPEKPSSSCETRCCGWGRRLWKQRSTTGKGGQSGQTTRIYLPPVATGAPTTSKAGKTAELAFTDSLRATLG